jgi:DNA-binding transcriptional LysR family regulator
MTLCATNQAKNSASPHSPISGRSISRRPTDQQREGKTRNLSPLTCSRPAPVGGGKRQDLTLKRFAMAPKPEGQSAIIPLKPGGPLDCSVGQVLHEWCLAGFGIAWRSTWEVEANVAVGRLETVLDEVAAPSNGIHALLPQRGHLALRMRLWIDFLKHHCGQADFWAGAER